MTEELDRQHPGGLARMVKRGMAMAASGVVVVQVVSITQTLIVGRLLGPEQVGVYTAGAVLVGFVLMMTEGTMAHALIQREHDVEDAANTALIATAVNGLLLALATLAASPVIGWIFHSHEAGLIAAASSGVMLLHAFSVVPDALMQRAFQFKRRMFVDPAVSIAFAGTAIVFALLGYGAWAMVIGSYASMTVWVVLSWSMARWRPFRGRFSWQIYREMARFGLPVAIDGLADRLRESAEQMLVGRALGAASLGQFRYAFRIGMIPTAMVIRCCGYVLFPTFSRIAGDAVRFREAFLRALGWLWFAALPIAVIMAVAGEPIVVLLLGQEWRGAGNATEAMAGIGLGSALCSVAADVIKASGRSSLLIWTAALQLVVGLPVILLSLPYGLVGVGAAISFTQIVTGFAIVFVAGSVVKATLRELASCLLAPLAAALAALGVALSVEQLVFHSDQMSLLPGLASIVVVILVVTVVYLGTLRILSPTWSSAVWQAVGKALTKLRKRNQVDEEVVSV